MKTRILAGCVLVPLLFIIVLWAPKLLAAIVLGLLLAIAAYELLYATGLLVHPRLVIYSAVMSFAVTMWSYYGASHAVFQFMVIAYFGLLFAEMMYDHVKVRLPMVGLAFIGGLIIPYMLSALVRILTLNIGRYVILIPFIAAFFSDAGAYFVGIRFGKHKLAPVISPKKTIEGVVGGVVSSVIGMVLYALILDFPLQFSVSYGVAVAYGVLGSLVGTFGDLCFSIVKRQTGIKDYGNLIPGHGGALDRFDSLTLVAPLMEALLILMPIVVG